MSGPGFAAVVVPGRALLALLLVLGLADPAPLGGQATPSTSAPVSGVQALPDSMLDRRTHEIARQLRCVVCQEASIEESNSEMAREMKSIVREMLAEGRTEEEIKAYFVGRYGDFVLLNPRAQGFNLVLYILPVVAVLLGAAILFFSIRSWTAAPPGEGEVEDSDDPAKALT